MKSPVPILFALAGLLIIGFMGLSTPPNADASLNTYNYADDNVLERLVDLESRVANIEATCGCMKASLPLPQTSSSQAALPAVTYSAPAVTYSTPTVTYSTPTVTYSAYEDVGESMDCSSGVCRPANSMASRTVIRSSTRRGLFPRLFGR